MDEDSAEIKIDHHNGGPDPEVEKRLEEESMAAMGPRETNDDGEEVTISTKEADLEVEATEPVEKEEPKDEESPAPKPVEKPTKTEADGTKKANTLAVAIVVLLFMIALAVVGVVLAVRYFGK